MICANNSKERVAKDADSVYNPIRLGSNQVLDGHENNPRCPLDQFATRGINADRFHVQLESDLETFNQPVKPMKTNQTRKIGMNSSPPPLTRTACTRSIRAGLICAGIIVSAAHAGEQLLNPSFDLPGGQYWTVPPGAPTSPFATAGQVDLSRTDISSTPPTHLWQTLSIPNVSGVTGTAAVVMQMPAGPPHGYSFEIYLDYLDVSNIPRRMLLLQPDNSKMRPGGTYFSTPLTVPADAKEITRFSIDKVYGGSFLAMDFSLNLNVPSVTVTGPADGTTVPAGTPVALDATVDTAGKTITCVEFYSGTTLIGQAQPSVYGEWSYANDVHLSIMEGWQGEMGFVDYSPPQPEQMFTVFGTHPTPLTFSGTFSQWAEPEPHEGPCNITFSFGSDGTLNAVMTGSAPLGTRTLTGGTPSPDAVHYTLNWPAPPAGSHSITAKACYGTNLSTTSAPVQLTIGTGSLVIPSLEIRKVSATEVELSWPDTGTLWRLESRNSLISGSWSPVLGTPTLTAGRYSHRVSMSGPTCFYHLASP